MGTESGFVTLLAKSVSFPMADIIARPSICANEICAWTYGIACRLRSCRENCHAKQEGLGAVEMCHGFIECVTSIPFTSKLCREQHWHKSRTRLHVSSRAVPPDSLLSIHALPSLKYSFRAYHFTNRQDGAVVRRTVKS